MTAANRRPGIAPPSDDDLMADVTAGSVPAFGELYDRYCDRAYRVARQVCRDQSWAEDAVQNAFLSLWRSRATYQADRGSVAAWVMTVTRYRAIDTNRQNTAPSARVVSLDFEEPRAPDDPAEHVAAQLDAEHLRGLLDRLPPAQQEVITLAFYGGLTHTEIATQLNLPTGTVKGRMRLGLEKLRTHLDQTAATASAGPPTTPAPPTRNHRAHNPMTTKTSMRQRGRVEKAATTVSDHKTPSS